MAYTTIDDPSAYFQTATYTGNNSHPRTITNDGNSDLQPDWIWVKQRTTSTNHFLYDSSRTFNANGELASNDGGVEGSFDNNLYGYISAATSDGFTVSSGTTNGDDFNQSSREYVAWQWKANGGTTASNTDGDINSTVQVNQDAGFSIMTYSGTTGDVHTIGHGLGVTPDVWIVKQRSGNSEFKDWFFWHKDMAASNIIDNRMLFLNLTDALATYTGINAVTSSTIRVKSSTTAQNGDTFVAYAFAEKQGYSKFSKYVGNGNDNGPFMYTGFKPAFVLTKGTHVSQWRLYDSARSPNNVNINRLFPYTSSAEATDTDAGIDMLSNGFKIRGSGGDYNASGQAYIYMAFAENPFVTSTGIPTTAR